MTSSLYAHKRREMNIPFVGSWDNHYITGGGHECHPDYVAYPLNNPHGARICVRKPLVIRDGRVQSAGGTRHMRPDLYNPDAEKAVQITSVYTPSQRVMPHLHRHAETDLLRLPIRYDANGIAMKRYHGYQYHHEPSSEYDATKLHQVTPKMHH